MTASGSEHGRSRVPLRYRRRRDRLRPVFPNVDWLIIPNFLAYVMSWYGLLVGKFPLQLMCLMLGIGTMFLAGLSRFTLVDLQTRDFLPTDSESQRERIETIQMDIRDKELNSTYAKPQVYPNSYVASLNRKKRQSESGQPGTQENGCRVASVILVSKVNESDPNGGTYNLIKDEVRFAAESFERMIYEMPVEVRGSKGEGGVYYYERSPTGLGAVCSEQADYIRYGCGGFTFKVMRSLLAGGSLNYDGTGRDPLKLMLLTLTWPQYSYHDLSKFFGKVSTVDNIPNNYVTNIGAMRMVFCVRKYVPDAFMRYAQVTKKWEEKFHETLQNWRGSKYFDIYWSTELQREQEQNKLTTIMLPKLGITFGALMIWCAVSCLMGDAVRSKPWCGFIGVFSTLLACGAGFGIQLWMEPKFQVILMAVPLLTLAIGLDDMFILLEAWSETNPKLPVEERMMLSMNIGGTSIVITFFINLLDFVIGNHTPFPVIQMISQYAIATMVLDFFFQMTVFAPCLALFGHAEEKNRQSCCCCCIKAPTREEGIKQKRSGLFFTCCAGGYNVAKSKIDSMSSDQIQPLENHEDEDSALKTTIVNAIVSFPFRVFAIGLFFAYLALSTWSITQIQIGLKPERMHGSKSNLYDYVKTHRLYFMGYGQQITIVVRNELQYSDPKIRGRLIGIMQKLEHSDYFWGSNETVFWVRDFVGWANERRIDLASISSDERLLYEVQRLPFGFLDSTVTRNGQTLSYGSKDLHQGAIKIDDNSTRILMSRFRVRAKDMNSPQRQTGMLQEMRRILKSDKDIEMYGYHGDFDLYDQFLSAVPTTLYYCGVTLGVTVGVAFFLIPHPTCLFWVAIFVTSVLIGIIGLMRLWDMDLDSVSLINLLIAISFCADLVAHPIYIFMVSAAVDKKDKPLKGQRARIFKAKAVVKEVIGAAMPACVGTTLSVIAMATSDAYIFITFFRVMFLSVLLSVLHALIFVPAFLSFIGPSNSKLQLAVGFENGKKKEVEDSEDDAQETTISDVRKADVFAVENKSKRRKRKRRRREYKPREPFVARPPNYTFRARGYLGALNDVTRNGAHRVLPPTINRFQIAQVNPDYNRKIAQVKAELAQRSDELIKIDKQISSHRNSNHTQTTSSKRDNEKRLKSRRHDASTKRHIQKQSSEQQPQSRVLNIYLTPGNNSNKLKTEGEKRPQVQPLEGQLEIRRNRSSNLSSSHENSMVTSRSGMLMLPAKHRFNM